MGIEVVGGCVMCLATVVRVVVDSLREEPLVSNKSERIGNRKENGNIHDAAISTIDLNSLRMLSLRGAESKRMIMRSFFRIVTSMLDSDPVIRHGPRPE